MLPRFVTVRSSILQHFSQPTKIEGTKPAIKKSETRPSSVRAWRNVREEAEVATSSGESVAGNTSSFALTFNELSGEKQASLRADRRGIEPSLGDK